MPAGSIVAVNAVNASEGLARLGASLVPLRAGGSGERDDDEDVRRTS